MVIAINTIFFTKENEWDFFKKVLKAIIAAHPEHTFLIIGEEVNVLKAYPNTITVNIGVNPSGINRWSLWIYYKIKKILKKYNPDVLINHGEALLYFKEVPQLIFNPDLKYVQDPNSLTITRGRVFHLFVKRYYQKADSFVVVTDFEKNFLMKNFLVKGDKIHILNYGADKDLKPAEIEEREQVKEKYAKGFEYFLYAGFITSSKNLMILLKAFSAFKKRQKSSMQLLIMGKKGVLFNDFKKLIELYKYKNDVHIVDGLTSLESDQLISCAYTMIFPDQYNKSVNTLLTALKYEVPSIVTQSGSLSEAGGDAVMHFTKDSVPDLADKMMFLFKDEKFRMNLIGNSRKWIDQKNFQYCIEQTWEIVERLGKKIY